MNARNPRLHRMADGGGRPPGTYREIMRRIEALPQVDSASFAWPAPLGRMSDSRAVAPWGRDPHDEEQGSRADALQVSPDYFATMGIPILKGAGFEAWRLYAGENDPAAHQVVLSESLADRLFPDGDAVGRLLAQATFRYEDDNLVSARTAVEVIGVVGDVQGSPRLAAGPEETIYMPLGAPTAWSRPPCG